ncbi:hypothetical protein BDV28DRAFT_160461 [Aspergillus coremiiformis]|uniref:Uncharacterized protein n=1 Tax=Aspergillus coremiiformis TaxID=138285 RepID=A0A5N6YVG2_9EURO|nr:hypothetical protein BDV28DRAFT_160461 [Aspergillus coremiiformis]
MDEQSTPLGNQKRAFWRSSCRERLSQHIWETLGLKVQPSDVRLKPEEDMPYRWRIEDPCLEYLFQKYLSKHSVGAYMLLQREVGQKKVDLDLLAHLQAENLCLTEKLRLVENKKYLSEQATIEVEEEIKSQTSQEIFKWMDICEWYQARCLHCSTILGQMTAFLQGDSSGEMLCQTSDN